MFLPLQPKQFCMKTLFLLDAFALIYRAHFALSKNPRFTSGGLNTSAIMGFTNTLLEVLKKENPSHLAVVFDTAAPTERHTSFENYKAHRESMPEDISAAIPYIKRLIDGFNIPVIFSDGYEADDVIGTLAKKAEKEGFRVYCMTPDKDFAQLVSENIFIYKPARMGNGVEVLGVKEVLEKWEVTRVEQVIDILGLWGDAVDNIPGIPGVGEKTAKLLIKQFDSVENIIANSHELKGKLRENVENFAEQGIISKKLATILLDAPIELDEVKLRVEAPNREALEPLFAELEFRTIGKRIFGDEFSVPQIKAKPSVQMDLFSSPPPINEESGDPIVQRTLSDAQSAQNTPHVYHLVDSLEEIAVLATLLSKQTSFGVDTETTGLDPNDADLVGLAFAIKPTEAWYIPMPADRIACIERLALLKDVLENDKIKKIGHNIKYDILILGWYDIQVQGALFDTMLAHYLLNPDARQGMNLLAETYLNYTPISITSLIGAKGKKQGSMRDVPLAQIKEYAAEDADITIQLKTIFEPMLEEAGAIKLAHQMEYPLVYVLAEMEREGVRIDPHALREFSATLETDIRTMEQSIYEKAGVKFNVASPKQLGEVLFDKLQLDPKAKKTKTGQYQTGEDVLQALASKSDIVKDILDFRQMQKLKSTYVDALPLMINPKTGRVHTSYNQAVAATGRLSSNNPNLQNIPIRTERGREVRKAFIARDADHVLLSADYSQIELRLIAEISQDENMLDAFKKGLDIHTATAAKVYSVPLEEVTSTQRRNAKAVNFGIIYGQSAFGLSQSLGIPRKEAGEIIQNYFAEYPKIKQYMSDTVEFAREYGYVKTLLGRRRYLRDINSANATVRGYAERNAINAPIQGSAADMIKIAMIHIHQDIKNQGLKSKMTMQVHDELIFDVHKSETEILKNIVIDRMKNALQLSVPIVVEAGFGTNWLEAH